MMHNYFVEFPLLRCQKANIHSFFLEESHSLSQRAVLKNRSPFFFEMESLEVIWLVPYTLYCHLQNSSITITFCTLHLCWNLKQSEIIWDTVCEKLSGSGYPLGMTMGDFPGYFRVRRPLYCGCHFPDRDPALCKNGEHSVHRHAVHPSLCSWLWMWLAASSDDCLVCNLFSS